MTNPNERYVPALLILGFLSSAFVGLIGWIILTIATTQMEHSRQIAKLESILEDCQ